MGEHKIGNLSVYKSDIKNIGHTICEEFAHNKQTGKTCFICDVKTANIEEIILREILVLYGYKIEDTRDYDDGDINVIFATDMPWKEYMELEF